MAEILRLYRLPTSSYEVARLTGVTRRTVMRYVNRFCFDARPDFQFQPHEKYNPLYDPLRDGFVPPLSLTAQLCGDPQPGRRELIAKTRVNFYDAAVRKDTP